jgi:hypothetical protein
MYKTLQLFTNIFTINTNTVVKNPFGIVQINVFQLSVIDKLRKQVLIPVNNSTLWLCLHVENVFLAPLPSLLLLFFLEKIGLLPPAMLLVSLACINVKLVKAWIKSKLFIVLGFMK